jgi:hypothetical protein
MTAVGRALSLAEMVHNREQHAESDQHSEPERCSDEHGVHFVLPYSPTVRREHILCAWKAPRLGQEIPSDEIADAVVARHLHGPSRSRRSKHYRLSVRAERT